MSILLLLVNYFYCFFYFFYFDPSLRKAIMAFGVFLWALFTLAGSFVSGREEYRGLGWGNPDFLLFLGCRAMVGSPYLLLLLLLLLR